MIFLLINIPTLKKDYYSFFTNFIKNIRETSARVSQFMSNKLVTQTAQNVQWMSNFGFYLVQTSMYIIKTF